MGKRIYTCRLASCVGKNSWRGKNQGGRKFYQIIHRVKIIRIKCHGAQRKVAFKKRGEIGKSK